MKIWLLVLIGLSVSKISYAQNCTQLSCLLDYSEEALSKISDKTITGLATWCLQDHQIPACLTLGKFYDLKQQEPQGEPYYLQACKLRSAQGCLLGGYNLERQGLEYRSNDLYLLGCLQTDNGSQNCVALAQNYREQRNWEEALKYYEMACDKENGQGCFLAQEIYNFVKSTPGKWKYLLTRGCKFNHANACYKLAYYAQSMDEKLTARWGFEQACIQGIFEACEEFKTLNHGGVWENWWSSHKIYFINLRDRLLFNLETIFPPGPRRP